MSRLRGSLDGLASRGRPRGAGDVFAGATEADTTARPTETRVRPWLAFAAAFGGVLMLGLVMASLMSAGERAGQVGSPSATTPTGAACLAPPAEATGTEGVAFNLSVSPSGVTAGSLANLVLRVFEGDLAGYVTGLATAWQCWDGSGWVDMYMLVKGTAGYTPTVAAVGSATEGIGFNLPLEASILIPDVGPGIYRVLESVATDDGMQDSWTFVEVFDPESLPIATTVPDKATLPPTSPGPGPTVPQGAELSWYDFIPGSVQLAWRSTATGTELCWRTVDGEDCVDDDFRAPEVVVIPDGAQLVAISRRPLSGLMPDRVILELSNGDTMDAAPLYQGPGVELIYSFSSPPPEGVTVVSARTADWPAPSCQTAPSSNLDVSGSAFDMRVSSSPARAGQIIELFIGRGREDNITGIPTLWQCWDGTDWINTHVGTKVSRATSGDPEVYRVESSPRFAAIGIGVPDTFRIRVPDLPPGTYRIEDYVGSERGWVIVEIED